MSRIVWSPEKGWHDGEEVDVVFDHGKIKVVPKAGVRR